MRRIYPENPRSIRYVFIVKTFITETKLII